MANLMVLMFALLFNTCKGQTSIGDDEQTLISNILMEPSPQEIKEILVSLRKEDLSPQKVVLHDSFLLSNTNRLFILSHQIEDVTHYGAIIVPSDSDSKKLPIVVFATGGDGMHEEFDISQDFNHPAAQFPSFLGEELDRECIVVIPCFRGQKLIIRDIEYQSDGKRIKRAIVVAAPTDMKALYQLYPDQFKLLFFNDLLAGNISVSEARRKFISISPIYFVEELPLVQLHHDKNDPFVPVDFANNLVKSMKAHNKSIDSYFYDEGIHGFWTNRDFWPRVKEFIIPLR